MSYKSLGLKVGGARWEQTSRAWFQNQDMEDPTAQIHPWDWNSDMTFDNHQAAVATDPDLVWERNFPMFWRRIADLPAMVVQVMSCPMDHMHTYISFLIIAERFMNFRTQWAVAHSSWCTRMHNFFRFVPSSFPKRTC